MAKKKEEKKIDLYTIRYKNSMKPIDWGYYTKYYPEKVQAIYALRLDTNLSLADAQAVIEEIFDRIERGEVSKREIPVDDPQEKKRRDEYAKTITDNYYGDNNSSVGKGIKAAGKGMLVAGGLTAYFGLGVIAKLTSKYMKK